MNRLKILQTDPKAGYLAHREEIDSAIARVLAGGWYVLGSETAAFEREFATFIGASNAIGVANCTDALELALRACGIGPGSAVVTVAHTAVATVAAIELTGANVVFADINPETYTIASTSLDAVIRQYSASSSAEHAPLKAIIAVHLYGHPADLTAIQDIATRHSLLLIEDCAQSHGAKLHGRTTGTWGTMAAFSFYPTKNLGALGDGGAVVTNDTVLAEKVRALREYGWRERYISHIPGMNSRLDELQSAILRAKLPHLAEENARRAALAKLYDKLLADSRVQTPVSRPEAGHVHHQYVIRTAARDALRSHLAKLDVGTLIHYPVPVHQQPAYLGRCFLSVNGLPETERAASQVLSLPMHPQLTDDQVRHAAGSVNEWSGQ